MFKKHCLAVGLDVPMQIEIGDSLSDETVRDLPYPVIIKPVDSCASKGLRVCRNEQEFRDGYDYAMSFSPSKHVIVEEFIEGLEMAPEYFILDGKIHATSEDLIIYGDRGNGNNMCVTIYPNTLEADFHKACDEKVQKLCDRLGCKHGNFYFELMYAKGKYYFLELIHRVDGVGIWSLTDQIQGFNVIKRMVNYALGREDPKPVAPVRDANVGGIYFYWANPGKIAKIVGVEEVKAMPGVQFILERFKVGDIIEDTGSMLQMPFYLSIVAKNYDQFIEKLKTVTDTLKIFDENGVELTVPTIPEAEIRRYALEPV